MKRFWLILAHVAVAGAGTAAAIFFPAAAPLIVPTIGAINAAIPSPLSPVPPKPPAPQPK